MLVLSRKSRESVIVGDPNDLGRLLKVTVLEIHEGAVRLGFEAPHGIPVHRQEVWNRIHAKNPVDSNQNSGAGHDA